MSLFEYSTAYKPIFYPWAYDLAREHESIHWTEDEVELGTDVEQWRRDLTEPQRQYVAGILRMFTQADVNAAQSYYDTLLPHIKNNEVRNMLGSFACAEQVHQRAYALLNDTLGLDESEYQAFLYEPVLTAKNEFMTKNYHDMTQNLPRQIFSEGVLLFGSFVMLLNFQRFGLLPGTVSITRWSLAQETLHVRGLSKLFKVLTKEVGRHYYDHVYELAEQTYVNEAAFIDYVFDCHADILQLTAEQVKEYIKYMIDRRLIQMGKLGMFNVRDNPLPWVDDIIGTSRLENFFETRVTEYNAIGMSGEWIYSK